MTGGRSEGQIVHLMDGFGRQTMVISDRWTADHSKYQNVDEGGRMVRSWGPAWLHKFLRNSEQVVGDEKKTVEKP